VFALLIDAYHCEIKDGSKVRKAACYIVLGIDMEGKKDIFGLYTFFGKENRADWNKVFEDLINRGLKRVLVVVSDDFQVLSRPSKLYIHMLIISSVLYTFREISANT